MAAPIFLSTTPHAHFDDSPINNDDIADKHRHMHVPSGDDCVENMDSETSRLLLLPKELRLDIWKYVLVDPSKQRPVLRIMRPSESSSTSRKRFCNSLCTHAKSSEVETSFEEHSTFAIGTSLLRTNNQVYEEAVPILYQSIIFCPWSPEGIFPLFLKTLSTYAKSSIRYIRLDTNQVFHDTTSSFYWAMTCAHVATLGGSLHRVEVNGQRIVLPSKGSNKHAILYPLLKIKATKVLVDGCDTEFQRILVEAATEWKAKADVRKQSTISDTVATKGLSDSGRCNIGDSIERPQPEELSYQAQTKTDEPPPVGDERHVAHTLTVMPDIKWTDKELLKWDMVSVASAAPSLNYSTTIDNEDVWIDVPSVTTDQENDENDSSDEVIVVDDWEVIQVPVLL
jgi:hypothetical protein